MKIALITMQGVYNYGSALQTYATQHYLEKMGHQVEVIDYYPRRMRNYGSLKQLYRDAKPFHKSRLKSFAAAFVKYWSFKKLRSSFLPFQNEMIKKTRKYESNADLCENPPIADVYCTGSDQVWNDYLEGSFDNAYFLDFAPKGRKRIAYSASFGRDDITPLELEPVTGFLREYSAISVREHSGLEILSEIDVPDKTCVLDPTFMLTGEEWRRIAGDVPEKGYILVYKLHEDSIASEIALEIAKKQGKKAIRLSTDFLKRIKGGKTIVGPEVRQFISYIANADMVVTDSFHATSFAINLNVPFISVRWKMFNGRIETILEKTNLQSRSVASVEEALSISECTMSFENANRSLQEERKKTEDFLTRALH